MKHWEHKTSKRIITQDDCPGSEWSSIEPPKWVKLISIIAMASAFVLALVFIN